MFLPKTHIHLGVVDASRSASFYEALLRTPPTRQTSSAAVFESESPPLILSLERVARRRPSHFSLLVTDPRQVADAAIALRRAGIRLRLEDEGIQAEDPDGNAWQVRLAPSGVGPTVRGPQEERHR
jgi:hypothetical protein